jgi:methyltransferase family protein
MTEPTPATIMQLASGFMAAKHLFAANELGLFEALADSPATLEALAARTGLTRRAARISADAMVALGLLEVQDGTYRNGKAAARFLSGPGPQDLRPAKPHRRRSGMIAGPRPRLGWRAAAP